MTWTNTHTIPWVDNTTVHDALVYLFDTYLNGKSMFTVSAHPDASAFKRSYEVTYNNAFTGTTAKNYFWTSWNSTTGTSSWTVYKDNTYTTVPGDLGTSTTNSVSYGTIYLDPSLAFRFWTSDLDPNACLVTRGKRVFFYWPGNQDYFIYEDATWDGTGDNLTSHLFPVARNNLTWSTAGAPSSTTTTGTEYYVAIYPQKNNFAANSFRPDTLLFKSPSFNYSATSTGLDANSFPCTTAPADQAVLHTSNTANGNFVVGSQDGLLLLLNGTEYWYAAAGTTYQPLCFYMGTSEPDLS